MGRNFKHRYFLVHGNSASAEAVNFLSNGMVTRDVKDISTIDLSTFGINRATYKEELSKYNPNVDIDGSMFIVSYPHRQFDVETFPAIFNSGSETCEKYIKGLEQFARERECKVLNGDNIALDVNARFNEYIYSILLEVYKRNDKRLLSENSLLAPKLKEIMKHRSPYKGAKGNIDANIYVLRSILSNYKQLRILTYSHIFSCDGKNPEQRKNFNKCKGADYSGLERIEPYQFVPDRTKIVIPDTQLTLDCFIDDPNLRREIALSSRNVDKSLKLKIEEYEEAKRR